MLWPADEQFVRRDSALPGLGLLLDEQAMCRRLRELLGIDLDAFESSYVRYKPGTSCLVAYRVRRGDDIAHAYGRALAREQPAKLRKSLDLAGAHGPFGPGALALDEGVTGLWFFPNDAAVRSLRMLGDADGQARLLGRVLPGALGRGRLSLEPLALKPERRHVIQVAVDDVPVGVVKLYQVSAYARAARVAKLARSGRLLRVAERRGRSSRYAAMGLEWIDGTSLQRVMTPGNLHLEQVKLLGRSLAELHLQRPSGLPQLTGTEHAAAVTEGASAFGWLMPTQAESARELAAALGAALKEQHSPACLLHGDLHWGQAVVCGDRMALIDLDEAAAGDPAWDLGDFLAHLEIGAESKGLISGDIDQLREALCDGYGQEAAVPRHSSIDLYAAAGLMRLLTQPFRQRCRDWPARCQWILDRARFYAERVRSRAAFWRASSACVAVSDELGAVSDPGMPVVAAAISPPTIAPHLERIGLALRAIRVIRHKPGRRCLIEYDVEPLRGEAAPFVLIGKVRAKGADKRTFALMQELWKRGFDAASPDGISVPQPVAIVPELQMWLQRKVTGVSAAAAMWTHANLPRGLVDAVVKLHRAGVATDRSHTPEDELAILDRRLRLVIEQFPQWTPRLEGLIQRCRQFATSTPAAGACGVHRDYYPEQVVVEGDRLYLLDLDLYCRSDPALDVGNCIAHVREHAIRKGIPDALAGAEAAMARRFCDLWGEHSRPALDLYVLLALARHIQISTLFADRRHVTQAMLEWCERRLDEGG